MSIKLVAIDIDGTLLNSKKEITPSVFEAIQDAKAAGVKIVDHNRSSYRRGLKTFKRTPFDGSWRLCHYL